MKKKHAYISMFSIALTMAGLLFFECSAFAQDQVSTNLSPLPPGFATRADFLNSLTTEDDILKAYHAGKISKDEAAQALVDLGDKVSMDTYGKVIDQEGQPVAGVKVQGHVHIGIGDSEEHDTETDDHGLFHLLGQHGSGLNVDLQKEGYIFNYMLPSAQRPNDYLPDSNSPLIFSMWKLRGAEPMVHDQIHAYIPCDGSVASFDLLTGKKGTDGNFRVSLTRNPVSIIQGKPFAWTVTLEVTNGGLVAITNVYPNEAPAEGYQSEITFDFQPNSKDWSSHFTPKFYFKAKNGQVFGRMAINIMSDFQPPPTLFDAEIYANPGGSRNLEFDPSKQIRR